MKTINIHDAKTNLSALLAEIEKTGETVLICRNGEPVADLSPHRKSSRLKPHSSLRNIKLKYDPTEPLSEADWPVEES